MFCSRCNRYITQPDLVDHLLAHQEITIMTAFTDVQSVIDAATDEINAATSRVQAQITSLNGTVDLSKFLSAVDALNNVVPAPVVSEPTA